MYHETSFIAHIALSLTQKGLFMGTLKNSYQVDGLPGDMEHKWLWKKTNEGQSIIQHSQSKQQVRGGQLIRQFAQAEQHGSFEWISGPSHNVKSKACTRG